jgi:hypothetical protein
VFCTNCGKELADDANFCLQCGVAQSNDIIEARKALARKWVRRRFRTVARWYSLVAGLVFLALLLVPVVKSRDSSWTDPWFWAALLGILTLIIVPQVLWRDKAADKSSNEPKMPLVTVVAAAFVGLGFCALIYWGGRLAASMTLDNRPIQFKLMILGLVLLNAAFVVTLANTLDKLGSGRMAQARGQRFLLIAMACQILANLSAEILRQAYY